MPDAAGLEAASLRADPVADAAIAAMARAGPLTGDLLAAARVRAEDADVARLLAEGERIPADPDAIERANRVMSAYAPQIGMVLAVRCLLLLYASPPVARVLVGTGRLVQGPERRVLETGRFLELMVHPGALGPGGAAHDAVLRVRLQHAYARRALAPTWEGPGPPVDQRSMLFTLTVFSVALRRGLVAMGAGLTRREQADHLALWRHVGLVIGIEQELIPATLEEEEALFEGLLSECLPGPEGRALASALIEGLARRPPYWVPPAALYALSRRLIGDALADGLGLPRHARWQVAWGVAAKALRALDRGLRATDLGFSLASRAGRAYAAGILAWRLPDLR